MAGSRRPDVGNGGWLGGALYESGAARSARSGCLSTSKRRTVGAPAAKAPREAELEPSGSIVVMGEVVTAYGVRGWVKVKPFTEQPHTLADHPTWWLRRLRGHWQPLAVVEAREHSGSVIAQLAGIASRESAMQWKGARVGVPREALPSIAAGEIYQADLIGLEVMNRAGTRLGRVTAVQDFGAHPVLDVEREEGGHRLIPFVPARVDGVDLAARRIDVDWEADY